MSEISYVIRISDPTGEHDTVYIGPLLFVRDADDFAERLGKIAPAGAEVYVETMYSPADIPAAMMRYISGRAE